MSDTEPFKRAHDAALRFLSYRPRSEAEVRVRLLRRFPEPLVEQVIGALREQALVDDASFASSWKESRDALKPRSAWAVKRELIAKGVDRSLAEEAVRDMDDEESAYRAGLKLAQKVKGADLPTFRHKLRGYLQRRGFADSVSRRTINRLWEDMGCGNRQQDHQQEDV